MKTLIKHLVRENMAVIAANSFFNCHCMGLHSIMLINSPGQTVRLYIAPPNNELWRNDPVMNYSDTVPMSIGFHPHHCNITLNVIKGTLYNHTIGAKATHIESAMGVDIVRLQEYSYQSAIKEGKAKFIRLKSQKFFKGYTTTIHSGDSLFLSAEEMHTVFIEEKAGYTAWFVYEGKENPNHENHLFTNTEPDVSNPEFYKPMKDPETIISLLTNADLL